MRALIAICILFSSCNMGATFTDQAQEKVNLLIGTYTDSGDSEGIYVYTFDSDSGTLTYKNKLTGIDNPSFLTLSPDLKHVYAVSDGLKNLTATFTTNNLIR